MSPRPAVTFVVVARDAAEHLPGVFADFLAQDYPRERMEFLLVDGMSEDRSREIAQAFKAAHPGLAFKILENKGRRLASGWNVALAAASGEVLLRVDAHCAIPKTFVRKSLEALEGHDVAGGPIEIVFPERGFARLLALAEHSRFGGGAAAFRHPGPARYVDTLAHAAYRREVFAKVGGYHELLGRTEDNEIHHRMKQAGYRFWFTPEISSSRKSRATLRGLLAQKFGNGYWIGVTLAVAPGAFGVRHFVPAVFLVALTAAPSIVLPVYLVAAVVFALAAVRGERPAIKLAAPLLVPIFFLMHWFYGAGTLVGLLALPFHISKLSAYKVPRPL